MKTRLLTLLLSTSAATWLALALTVAPALNLGTVTLAAAAVIIAVQFATLAYAVTIARVAQFSFGGVTRRKLDNLDWLGRLCTILGLLGTVAGFSSELRTLHTIHGGLDPAGALDAVGKMSLGFGTAMISTFVGVCAYATVSLAEHLLQGDA